MIDNLTEAIAHAKEVAENVRYNAYTFTENDLLDENCRQAKAECLECAAEHEQLAEWLTELQERREADRWIPISERLPEAEYGESDSVLVCFENETRGILYFNGGNWCYPTGETYISVNHKNGWHNKVVAWMPLPKPYKPEGSEEKSRIL